MLDKNEGNELLKKIILEGMPLSLIRLRSETKCLYWYLKNKFPFFYPKFYEINGGLYPRNKKTFIHYAKLVEEAILPPFKLLTLRPIQSSAGGESPFNSWSESLEVMVNQVKNLDFDIALIGCGCYDIPLSNEIKKLGKQAIILGGSLQIMFGIRGKRWDNHEIISKLYNEHWVSPSTDETPHKFKNVEKGCYW